MTNILGPGELEIEPLDPCPRSLGQCAGKIKDQVIVTFSDGGGSAYNVAKREWHN